MQFSRTNEQRNVLECRRWRIPLVLILGLGFWIVSSRFLCPVYSDELGYISNSTYLAGNTVEGSTSYHSGYSFFLVPAYYLVNDPFQLWQCFMIINTLMWIGSFALLFYLSDALFPDSTETQKKAAVLWSALYPAGIVMCGYAFSSGALTVCMLIAIFCLLQIRTDNLLSIVPHAMVTGFLYWIHPTGLAAVGGSFLCISWLSIRKKQYRFLFLNGAVLLIVCLIYKAGIKPWLVSGMTYRGTTSQLHYPSTSSILMSLMSGTFLVESILRTLGQFSYLCIASGGVIIGGVACAITSIKGLPAPTAPRKEFLCTEEKPVAAYSFAIIGTIGSAVMGAISLSCQNEPLIDSWIYGRYCEPFSLFILLGGFLWGLNSIQSILGTSAVLIPLALAIDAFRGGASAPSGWNLVNVPGLWAFLVAPYNSVFFITVAGVIGMVFLNLAGTRWRNLFLAVLFMSSTGIQLLWHFNIASRNPDYGLVTSLRTRFSTEEIIHGNSDSFVRFNPRRPITLVEWRLMALFSFYFHDHEWERTTFSQWTANGSRGMFLGFPPLESTGKSTSATNQKLLVHRPLDGLTLLSSTDIRYFSDEEKARCSKNELFGPEFTMEQLNSGVHSFTARDLHGTGDVGNFENDLLKTTGKRGILFKTPSLRADRMPFLIQIKAQKAKVDGSFVSIYGRKEATDLIKKIALKDCTYEHSDTFVIPIRSDKPYFSITTVLEVSEHDEIQVSECTIAPVVP